MKKFTWELGFFCFFKCFYCFYSLEGWENLLERQKPIKGTEEIVEAWNYIYGKFGKAKIYITGGEPFLYPDFNLIVKNLAKLHKIEITSNLSVGINEFIDINRDLTENIEFNATFHPMYIDINKFLEKVLLLRENGFKCRVCYLAHPVQLREMLLYKRYFLNFKIVMTPVEFVGNFRNRNYPEEYSKTEKEFLNLVLNWDNNWQISAKELNVEKEKVYSGEKQCIAGYSYGVIDVKGNVRPCGQLKEPILGNIFKKDVEFLDKPIKCNLQTCKCAEFRYEED